MLPPLSGVRCGFHHRLKRSGDATSIVLSWDVNTTSTFWREMGMPPPPRKEKLGGHLRLLNMYTYNIHIYVEREIRTCPINNMLYYTALYSCTILHKTELSLFEEKYGFHLHLLKWHVGAKSYFVSQVFLCLWRELGMLSPPSEVRCVCHLHHLMSGDAASIFLSWDVDHIVNFWRELGMPPPPCKEKFQRSAEKWGCCLHIM